MTYMIVPREMWEKIKSTLYEINVLAEGAAAAPLPYPRLFQLGSEAADLYHQAGNIPTSEDVEGFITGVAQDAHNAINGDLDDYNSWVHSIDSWYATLENATMVLEDFFDTRFQPADEEDE